MQTVELALLQLEAYYVKEFAFTTIADESKLGTLHIQPGLHFQREEVFTTGGLSVDVRSQIGVKDDDPYRYRIELSVRSTANAKNQLPYSFNIIMIGMFRLPISSETSTDEDANARLFYLNNAANILYTSAREYILMATGRGPFPAILMPTAVLNVAATDESSLSDTEDQKKRGSKRGTKKQPTKKMVQLTEK